MIGDSVIWSRKSWERIINEISDVFFKSSGLVILYILGPSLIPISLSTTQSILSGDILTVLLLVIITPLILRCSKPWKTHDTVASKSIDSVMYGVVCINTAYVVLVGSFLVIRFGIVASIFAGAIVAAACVFVYNPKVFSDYLLKPDLNMTIVPESPQDYIIDEREFSHYLTLDELEYREDS